MTMTQDAKVASLPHPVSAEPGSTQVHFALLTQAEQETFRAGLQTRIRSRLLEAVGASTAQRYLLTRNRELLAYPSLVQVWLLEQRHKAAPVEPAMVAQALERVEKYLGESWRHKLEHAINISSTANQIMARVLDRGQFQMDETPTVMLFAKWVGGWNLLNWSTDCVLAATEPEANVQTDVVEAIFQDLHTASDQVYTVACDVYELRFGDPDDEAE